MSLTQTERDDGMSSAGLTQYLFPKKKEEEPVLYDFDKTLDEEIIHNEASLKKAESMTNHTWSIPLGSSLKAKPEDPPVLYDFEPSLDGDIIATHEHIAEAE
jgi:hypothetical protein